jgi:hypothetical protein
MVIEMNKSVQCEEEQSQQNLLRELAEQNACYVLITCAAPKDGKMEVAMIYEGCDESLAAYLIESAQSFIE